MTKKVLLTLLAMLLAVTFIAGCGSTASTPAETTASPEATASSESDWAYIQDKGVLTVGVTNYPPMNYLGDDGKWTGFDTEFAQAVCDKLGIKADFIEISWDAKETELQSKNIDCLWNGMCLTEEREKMWNTTKPYMNNTQAMVMKKDREEEIMKDVSGLNIVAEAGSTGEEKINGTIDDTKDDTVKVMAKEYFANSNYSGVESMATALMDVENNVADVAVVDYVIAVGMVGEGTSFTDLVINTDNYFGAQYFGIAFRKGSDARDKVEEAIDALRADGTLDQIAAKYNLTDAIIK